MVMKKREQNSWWKKGNHCYHHHQIIRWNREKGRYFAWFTENKATASTHSNQWFKRMYTNVDWIIQLNWITVNWINSHFHGYNSWIQSIFLRCRCICDLFAVTSAHTCRGIRSDCCRVCAPLNSLHSLVHWFVRARLIFREIEHFRDFIFFCHPLLFISVNIVMATFSTLNQNRWANEKENEKKNFRLNDNCTNPAVLYVSNERNGGTIAIRWFV